MIAFRKTLSVILVLGLMIGGIPIFFSQSAEAAAVVVVEKDDSAMDLLSSRGYLYVTVSQFPDEGGEPIPGYTMLIEWDYCYMELNPLAGFLETKRSHKVDTIISDEKGRASYVFHLPNGCWTENAWLRGAGQGWQSPPDYFLGQMASRSLHLNLYTQPSGATSYAQARADTLGLIEDWYELTPVDFESASTALYLEAYASQIVPGAAKISVSVVDTNLWLSASPTTSVGQIQDYNVVGRVSSSLGTYVGHSSSAGSGNWKNASVKEMFGPDATLSITNGVIDASGLAKCKSRSAIDPTIIHVDNAAVYGSKMYLTAGGSQQTYFQIWINGAKVFPETGWQSASTSSPSMLTLPYDPSCEQKMNIEIRAYSSQDSTMGVRLYGPQRASFVLTNLDEGDTSPSLTLGTGISMDLDLTGRWGTFQISGMSSTLTDEDLVPVNARIAGLYPLVISNPRFDKTPIAGAGNGLKFDAYNLRDVNTTETIYLSLIADGNTTVWSTTVGSRSYPPWANESQFTTVHLTDISFPADPRKEYQLRITSGGAVTEIPMVFYPAELDPDVVYGPKADLDEMIKAFGTVNAASLKAYYNWAVDMELRNIDLRSQVDNYTKIFRDRQALDELEAAKAASDRAAEMITDLKEICKGDPAGTDIGTLETLGQGIWNEYLAALLHREAAVAYEAGDTAFANSTAHDAFYVDVNGRRIYTGWDDTGGINNMDSSANWIALGVAVIAGGVVSYLLWTQLAKYMPKGGTKAMRRVKLIMPLAIGIVAGILVAIATYIIMVQVILVISNAVAGLGSLFGG